MKNQFQTLQNWTREVLNDVKKDLKHDYLPADPVFYKTNFGNRPLNKISNEEILDAYEKELLNDNADLAEFVVNRWVFKHGDLYQHFAERLSEINPDFDQIKELNEEETKAVLKGAAENFGAIPVFLFAVLNGVVFPEKALVSLKKSAEEEKKAKKSKEEVDSNQESLEKILASHAREVARLNNKIEGVLKKYTKDTEALKKQIRTLQKKIQ